MLPHDIVRCLASVAARLTVVGPATCQCRQSSRASAGLAAHVTRLLSSGSHLHAIHHPWPWEPSPQQLVRRVPLLLGMHQALPAWFSWFVLALILHSICREGLDVDLTSMFLVAIGHGHGPRTLCMALEDAEAATASSGSVTNW